VLEGWVYVGDDLKTPASVNINRSRQLRLTRNKVVFDTSQPKPFWYVLFRGTHWLLHWHNWNDVKKTSSMCTER
jgi:hypothetical protein